VDPRWRGQRARRRAHQSLAFGRSGAPKLTGGGAKGGEEHRELGSGVENQEAAALGERAAQAWREGKRSGERCGETH
jgi:hypothetical protein